MSKPRQQDPNHLSFSYFMPTGQTDHIWSDEAAAATPPLGRDVFLDLARAAEDTGFDSLFIADTWSGHQRVAEKFGHQSPKYQAPLLAMGLFAVTEHIGVITTIHTSHHKPAHVARTGATLDAFSDGRWGWNIVTGFGDVEAQLFGEEALAAHDDRYKVADEFVDVVKRFWTEDDPIEHRGQYFRATGRLKAPRPVQRPTPLLVSAGASSAGVAFAAKHCDQLVVAGDTIEKLRAIDAPLLAQLDAQGRRGQTTTATFAIAIIREGDGEAEEEYERLTESVNVDAALEIVADIFGGVETARAIYAGMDLDEMARAHGSGRGILKLFGNAEQVAEQLIEIQRETTTSNVLINFPLWSPDEVRGFRPVLNHLRDAGVWRLPSERDYSW